MLDFTVRVRNVVKRIPKGKVMTYQQVAEAVGNPRAARAVANVMAKNYDQEVPCHRVVRSDGTLGGYNRGGTAKKRDILVHEGYLTN